MAWRLELAFLNGALRYDTPEIFAAYQMTSLAASEWPPNDQMSRHVWYIDPGSVDGALLWCQDMTRASFTFH
jgi:hypothetical protein